VINVPKLNMAWRIKITFAGKLPPKQYITPDIRRKNPGWGDEIFNRTIESLELYLPTGHRLMIAGMEQYNFFVEAVQSPGAKSEVIIKAFYFCGKIPGSDLVETWKIIIPTQIEKGIVKREQKRWGHEWGNGPTSGWKPGVKGKLISAIYEDR
jgi:hypothetical protein